MCIWLLANRWKNERDITFLYMGAADSLSTQDDLVTK